MTDSSSPSSRVALITGASTGLGEAMAHALGARGLRVALNYANDQARAEGAFQRFVEAGHEGALVRGDVTDAGAVQGMVDEVAESLGPIDVLVLNATCSQPQLPIEEYDWDFYQRMLDFFVKSPFLLAQATLAHMKRQRWGRILSIGSEVYDRGVPNFSAYVAAKGAQRGWTRSMANELAPWSITVNMVSPGWIPVERHRDDPQERKDEYLAGIPLGRWGVPADIGAAAAYLTSEEAGFVTGQTLVVNGGVTVC